jgi:hypothetical protein
MDDRRLGSSGHVTASGLTPRWLCGHKLSSIPKCLTIYPSARTVGAHAASSCRSGRTTRRTNCVEDPSRDSNDPHKLRRREENFAAHSLPIRKRPARGGTTGSSADLPSPTRSSSLPDAATNIGVALHEGEPLDSTRFLERIPMRWNWLLLSARPRESGDPVCSPCGWIPAFAGIDLM